jgi:hypothetical protein
MTLVAGGKLYVLPDNRAVWEYDGKEFHPITGYDVNMMLVAGGKLYVLPNNRAVWEYDGKEFHRITGYDVKMMLVAGGKLYVLPDNRAVWEYDGKEFHRITGYDVNMMLVAGGKLYVLPDNRAVWEYDGKEFHPITGYDVNMMLVAGGKLYVLPDNRAVWEYDGKEFHRITGYDVNMMLTAGGKLFVLPDNRAVWEYDGEAFRPITGFDVKKMAVSNGKLYVYPDNNAVWKYDGTVFDRITDFNIEEFGYDKNGNLVWEEDGGFWDDLGDLASDIGDAILKFAPTLIGLFQTPIHGEAARALIYGDTFSWDNVGEMFVDHAKIGATIAASVLTAGAFGPAAAASIGMAFASGAAAGAAGAAAGQVVLALGDLSGLKNGYVFDPFVTYKSALLGGLTAGAKYIVFPAGHPPSVGNGPSDSQTVLVVSVEDNSVAYLTIDNKALYDGLQYDLRLMNLDGLPIAIPDNGLWYNSKALESLSNVKYDVLKDLGTYAIGRSLDPTFWIGASNLMRAPISAAEEALRFVFWGYDKYVIGTWPEMYGPGY